MLTLLCPTDEESGMLMLSVCIVILYLREEGEWGEGAVWVGSWNRQLALSKGLARTGIHCRVQRAAIPSKGSFFFFYYLHNDSCIFKHLVDIKKKNISSVQVQNKQCVSESEHVFILGSTVNMVMNTYDFKRFGLVNSYYYCSIIT